MAIPQIIDQDFFLDHLRVQGLEMLLSKPVAIAVSGGADSMALADLLCDVVTSPPHILTVDHQLRAESAAESQMVESYARKRDIPCHIFKWSNIPKPSHGIQEAARKYRYGVMENYCVQHHIEYLCLAHHSDDQRETFLFRLAKGSGLTGLTCMRAIQTTESGVKLVRPLLSFSHANLISVCRDRGLSWVEDPSNHSVKYMRGRMRATQELLDNEGLTSSRIITLTRRLARAESLIEQVALDTYENCCQWNENSSSIELRVFIMLPEEIRIRLLQKLLYEVNTRVGNPKKLIRLEDIERLCSHICVSNEVAPFRGATLGGVKVKLHSGIMKFLAE